MIAWLNNRWAAIAVVAGIQIATLAWIIIDRVSLLANGREIVLDVVPVDPRSLFRGDYVNLRYPISRLDAALVPDTLPRSGTAYVTLQQTPDGKWQAIKVSREAEKTGDPASIVIKGRMDGRFWSGNRPTTIPIRYGIESYFVPEGKGRDLEKLVGDKQLSVIVAVDKAGEAAIKGLVVEGQKIYDEPLL
jgi:uncharacterized membrane-anchored protein